MSCLEHMLNEPSANKTGVCFRYDKVTDEDEQISAC